MKRMHKIFFCIIIVLAVAGCSLSGGATTFQDEVYDSPRLSGSLYYYNTLNAHEREVYTALVHQVLPFPGTTTARFSIPPARAGSFEPTKAAKAFLLDHPETFWLKPSIGAHPDGPRGAEHSTALPLYWTEMTIEFYLDPDPGLSSRPQAIPIPSVTYTEEARAIYNKVTQIATKASAGGSRYAQLKIAHDDLTSSIHYYDTGLRGHTVSGGLLDYKGVCETYAKSFKLVCDKLEITSILVFGASYKGTTGGLENHMWNLVQMEDGNWYAVDLTLNDQKASAGFLVDDYFLIGTETVSMSFGANNKPFTESHLVIEFYEGATYPIQSRISYPRPE